MMKLLLPLDVIHSYEETLLELERLVPLSAAEVRLLYVVEHNQGMEDVLTSLGKTLAEVDEALKERAGKILDEIAQSLKKKDCPNVSIEIVHGHPAITIEAVAKREKSDVIAIGIAQQQHFTPFYLLGSAAANVVRHAVGTVLIVRSGVDQQKAEQKDATLRVLAAVDGSKQALTALKTFVTQFEAQRRKIAVTLLNVVSIPGIWKFISPVTFVASIEDNLNMMAETILADGDKALSDCGIKPAQMMIRSGDVAYEIIKASKDIKADLIVIGAQGKSGIEPFGSIADKLSMHAPCSIAVVK